VILPTCNRIQFLDEAIQSVLAQDYSDWLLVIVDDGSTDGTRQYAELLAVQHPERILYQYQSNGGCSSARNQGLLQVSESIGFVCFLDSDDRLLPGKFRREIELLQLHPEIDFTYSDSIVFDEIEQKEQLVAVAGKNNPGQLATDHFFTQEAKCSAVLYRAKILRGRQFREDLRYNEDSEFFQRIALEHRGLYVSSPGCWVRWHTGSKSRNTTKILKAVLQSNLEILQDYPDFYRSIKKLADRRIKVLQKMLFRELVWERNWKEARQYATGIADKFILAAHARFYLQLLRSGGKILRWCGLK
jgi:glycosyltransferase involved in cell wall biosynthesis